MSRDGVVVDPSASRGQQALEMLHSSIEKHWPALAPGQQQGLNASDAAAVLKRIEERLAVLASRRFWGTVQPASVAQRFRSSGLPHLAEDGPLAERDQIGRGPKEYTVVMRAFDDREGALRYSLRHSYTLKQIKALHASVQKLRGDLRNLHSTPLARHLVRGRVDATRRTRDVVETLRWYDEVFLQEIVRQARTLSGRKALDTRRIVIDLLRIVEVAAGRPYLEQVATVLNWRAPDAAPRKSSEWTARILRRWKSEAESETRKE